MATLTIGLARGDNSRGFIGCSSACTLLIGQPAEHPISPFLFGGKSGLQGISRKEGTDRGDARI